MKKLNIKTRTASSKWIFAIALTVLFHLTTLADPGDFGGGANPADGPAAPIDSYVWVLMGIGIAFVFYKYRAVAKKSKTSSVS